MTLLGPLLLLACIGAVALGRRVPSLWMVGVAGKAVIFGLMVMAATFGGLMSGALRLDWLLRWLGTEKLQRPWDLIVFFGPAIVATVIYFAIAASQELRTRA
jgi:hypothetical protein